MGSYFDILTEALKSINRNYKIEPDDFRFSLLLGKQRWFSFKEWDREILFELSKTFNRLGRLPFVGLAYGGELKFLDLEDKYEEIIDDEKSGSGSLYPLRIELPNFKTVIYTNYLLFGPVGSRFGRVSEFAGEEVITTCKKYLLDFYVFVSELSIFYRSIVLKAFVRTQKLTFKGNYLSHVVEKNTDEITFSFLVPIIEALIELRAKKNFNARMKFLAHTKDQFLDGFEIKFLKPVLMNYFSIDYKPFLETKDINERLKKIISSLPV